MSTSMSNNQADIPVNTHTLDALATDKMKIVVYAEGVHIEKTVELQYASASGELSVRTVDLHAYLDRGDKFYLVGYCRLRNSLRTFSLSQILRMSSDDEVFLPSSHRDWILRQPRILNQSAIEQRLRQIEDQRKPFEPKYNERSANELLDLLMVQQSSALPGTKWVFQRNQNAIALHKLFSTGKITKAPYVEISFLEFDSAFSYLEDGTMVEVERFPRATPWKIRSKPAVETYLAGFEESQEHFLQLVHQMTASDA